MNRFLWTTLMVVGFLGCDKEMDPGKFSMISVYPVSLTIVAEAQQTFTAFGVRDPSDLSWSIVEGDDVGGTVDSTGNYTAPSSAGSYHLKVALNSDPSVSTLVPIIVTMNDAVSVSVNPALAQVTVGSSTVFNSRIWGDIEASSRNAHWIAWGLGDGSKGTLLAVPSSTATAIRYTAPSVPGINYIEAVARPDDTKSAFVTVIVK
jgi:hypothetical protein